MIWGGGGGTGKAGRGEIAYRYSAAAVRLWVFILLDERLDSFLSFTISGREVKEERSALLIKADTLRDQRSLSAVAKPISSRGARRKV